MSLSTLFLWGGLWSSPGKASAASPACFPLLFDSLEANLVVRKVLVPVVAKEFNFREEVMNSFADHVRRENYIIFIRSFTPYYGSLPHKPKPNNIKDVTLKTGEYAGLVGWLTKDAPKLTTKVGAEFELSLPVNGHILLRHKQSLTYVSSDIDLQGVFELNERGDIERINTNAYPFWSSSFMTALPKEVRGYILHGANDDYLTPDGKPKRHPQDDEYFYAIDARGQFYYVPTVSSLRTVYKTLGLDWPYEKTN